MTAKYTCAVAITSRHNPIVARYRAAAAGGVDGVVLLDGVHLIGEALCAGLTMHHVAATTAAQEEPEVRELVGALARRGIETTTVSPPVMDALTPVRTSSGIAALAARPTVSAAELYPAGKPALVVIAVDVQDPGNLGAIARVAEAAGATGLIATEGSADPFGWKALRGSMGGSLRLPVTRTAANEAIAEAHRYGCRVVATVPRDAQPMYDVDLTGRLAILVGGEGRGLAASILDAADERVAIPMETPVESLNVAVAAALIVYEARRQRAQQTRKTHGVAL
jgi:RNA methyltransferase, TrmH family